MTIKFTIQGLLIYMAMAMYLLTFISTVLRRRRAGDTTFFAAFIASVISVAYRWLAVGHLPMQNLFEVLLCLGALVWPVSVFCRKLLRIGGASADMLIGAVVLFPAGFVFSERIMPLPPALQSHLFGPHVMVYMLSYILMTKAAIQAVIQLVKADAAANTTLIEPEQGTYRMVCAGFPLLTLGLILGSIWGQQAWGDWWGWDPKELWSLASWLVYVGYLHFRFMFGKKHPRINSTWAITGLVVIIITLLWVNFSRLFAGLHSYAL